MAHQRLGVEVPALLQHVGADRGERFRPVTDERAQARQRRRSLPRRERVDVHRLAVHGDAVLLQGVLERLHEEEGRVADRGVLHDGGGILRDPAGYDQRGSSGQPPQPDARRLIGAHGDDVVAQEQVGSRVPETGARRSARRAARFDDHLDHVSAVLQRSRGGREPAREVVPGPPAPEAGGLEGAVVEDVVVADDAPGDAAHAEAPQLVGPAGEDVPRARGVDRRIAGAAHHEIALQRSVADRCGGEQGRFEAVVPAEPFGRGREGDELHRRGGRQQHVGIAGVEPFIPVERPDIHTPDRGPDPARVEQPIEMPRQVEIAPTVHATGRSRLLGSARAIRARGGSRYSPVGVPRGGGIDRAFRRGDRRRSLGRATAGVGRSDGARKGSRRAGARHTAGHHDGEQNRCDAECPHVHDRARLQRSIGVKVPEHPGPAISFWRDRR